MSEFRRWKREQIEALLDESGNLVCPDCQTEMITRARFQWVVPRHPELKPELVAAVRCTCQACQLVINVDTQLQWASEWKRGRKCAA